MYRTALGIIAFWLAVSFMVAPESTAIMLGKAWHAFREAAGW